VSDAGVPHPLSHWGEVCHIARGHAGEAVGDALRRAYGGRMTTDREPTPADIELEDSLRSIRGVGENAGRGSAPDSDEADDTEPGGELGEQ
jgi:hypothetical protein